MRNITTKRIAIASLGATLAVGVGAGVSMARAEDPASARLIVGQEARTASFTVRPTALRTMADGLHVADITLCSTLPGTKVRVDRDTWSLSTDAGTESHGGKSAGDEHSTYPFGGQGVTLTQRKLEQGECATGTLAFTSDTRERPRQLVLRSGYEDTLVWDVR